MYEVTTIGGVVVPSTRARPMPMGELPFTISDQFKTKEVFIAGVIGLTLGLFIGAIIVTVKAP